MALPYERGEKKYWKECSEEEERKGKRRSLQGEHDGSAPALEMVLILLIRNDERAGGCEETEDGAEEQGQTEYCGHASYDAG